MIALDIVACDMEQTRDEVIADRVVEIATYLNLTEFPCKRCGVVHTAEDLDLEEKPGKKLIIKANCPDCGRFIRHMPTEKVKRIFYKMEYRELADIETSLLQWMMRVEYGSGNVQHYIQRELWGRTQTSIVEDFVLEDKVFKAALKASSNSPIQKVDQLMERMLEVQTTILEGFGTMDAVEMAYHDRIAKRIYRKIKRMRTKADEDERASVG